MTETPQTPKNNSPFIIITLIILFVIAGVIALLRGHDLQIGAVRPAKSNQPN